MGMRFLSGPLTHARTVLFDAGIAVSWAVSMVSDSSQVPSTVGDAAVNGSRWLERETLAAVSVVAVRLPVVAVVCVRAAVPAGVDPMGVLFHAANPPTGMAASRRTAAMRCHGRTRGCLLCLAIQTVNPAM